MKVQEYRVLKKRFWNLSYCPVVLEFNPVPHESLQVESASYWAALVQKTGYTAGA